MLAKCASWVSSAGARLAIQPLALLPFAVVRGALGMRAGRQLPLAPPSLPGHLDGTNLKMRVDGRGWGRRGMGVFEDYSLRHLVLLMLLCGLSCAVPLRSVGQSSFLSSHSRELPAVSHLFCRIPAAGDHAEPGRERDSMRNAPPVQKIMRGTTLDGRSMPGGASPVPVLPGPVAQHHAGARRRIGGDGAGSMLQGGF